MSASLRVIPLAECADATASLEWCTAAERARADTISSPARRAQFLAGRWLARRCLAASCGGSPDDWQLECTAGRAPVVLAGPARPHLSLAHRLDVVACALARAPVGVDVEVAREHRADDLETRARFVLSPAEARVYDSIAAAQRAVFLRAVWTLKEAWSKASGTGMELADLPLLAVRRSTAAGANARTWHDGPLTVAVVMHDPAELSALEATGLREPSDLQWWHVGPTTTNNGVEQRGRFRNRPGTDPDLSAN